MKKFLILCLAILTITVGVLAYVKSGQTKIITLAAVTTEAVTETKTETTTAAENEIRAILERYYEIARTNDREALKNFSREISAPEYVYSSELGTMDKTAAFRLFDSMKIEFASADFDDLTVQLHGDTAIAKYRDFSKVRANGDFMRTPMRFTNVWVKRGGKWQIVAEHSSVVQPPKLLPRHPLADNLARK